MSLSDHQYNDFHSSRKSDVWIRWEYSPEEWALFEQIDAGAIKRRHWRIVGISLLSYALLIGIVAWLTFPLPWPPLGIAGLFFVLPIHIIASSGRSYGTAKERQKARQKQSEQHRVTFSERGIWEAGAYFPLNGAWWSGLKKVEMTDTPPILHFFYREPFSALTINDDSSFMDTWHVLFLMGMKPKRDPFWNAIAG